MKAKIFFMHVLVGILFLSSTFTNLSAQEEPPKIPVSERKALISFFNATNGGNWKNKNGWLGNWGTEKNWFGVYVFETDKTANVIGIYLPANNLIGILSSSLGELRKLEYLYLNKNQLSGIIPSSIRNLRNLIYLDFNENQLTGNIPKEVGYLQNLKTLALCTNHLSGSIPAEIGNLYKLDTIALFDNELSGEIPEQLGSLSYMKGIYMWSNKLTGRIPSILGNLSKLEYINFSHNKLTGSIPKEFGKLSNLKYFSFCGNQLSGIIPIELGNLKRLEVFALFDNQISGEIPQQFGNLNNMKEIGLWKNNLTGNIPSSLGNLGNLRFFDINNNKLTGNIPAEFGDIYTLEYLDLSYNSIDGKIPSGIGNLNRLTNLYLNNNQLSGKIPNTMLNLAKLAKPNVNIGNNCLYAEEVNLIRWLNMVDPDWATYQNQCQNKCQLKIVNQRNGKVWNINNVLLSSEVKIAGNGLDLVIPVAQDGTFEMNQKIPSGYYDVTCKLQYFDNILFSNDSNWGGVPAPSGGKLIRQSVRKMTNVRIDEEKPTFDINFPPPFFLVHGIISGWTTWDAWVSYLLENGYIVFTPNHDFRGISKISEASQLSVQFSADLAGLLKNAHPEVYFICHSEGGVVTRVLVNHYPSIRNQIKCVFTLGTPHSGTDLDLFGLYDLSKYYMLFCFNSFYENFKKIPVYAISGHGLPYIDNKSFPTDGAVFWIPYSNEDYDFNPFCFENKSPFAIYNYNDFQRHTICTESFPGYSDSYTANGHHFGFWHSNLVKKGVDSILKNTIIPVIEGTFSDSETETLGENFNLIRMNLNVFLKNILTRNFTLSHQSTKRFQISVASTDLFIVNAMGMKNEIVLSLIDPEGINITRDNYSTYPSATYSSDSMIGVGYHISTPKTGKWTIDVTAGNVDDIIAIGASENSEWNIAGYTDKTSYQPNSKAVLNAKISGLASGLSVSSINANLSNEDGTKITTLELFDDGNHDDKSKGDGVYGNSMNVPSTTGKYLVTFHLEALSGGYPAQCESNWNFYVIKPETIFKGTFSDESGDSDSDGIKDQISAKIGLKISSAGQYILSGNLEDSSNKLIDNAVTAIEASNAGDYQGTLTFDMNGISCSQYKAPFKIKNLKIANANNLIPLDEWGTPVSTKTYNGNDFGCNATGVATIKLNREKLNFGVIRGNVSPSQIITIENSGSGSLNWIISSDSSWLLYDKESGTNTGIVSISVDSANLSAGIYSGILQVTSPSATNSPQSIDVTLKVYNAGETPFPFGEFATPTDGSTVSGSIAVTGWALDDIGVENVKLYIGELGNLTYIGDAIFVEGARPDIEQAYPGYPMNYKAGWGYMMLTNFLPNSGNGEFKIHAVATDTDGNEITLGTKSIRCDNAHAVKPFGAIDTPTQGGPASGKAFVNWGWVLTPLPNKIPEDGSKINVWVDGKKVGKPTYNIYREDIANLFPGFANSSGAIGIFYLDTTTYKNGIHTIQWTATDSAGNNEGIGSRYFSVLNNGESASSSQSTIKYQTQIDFNSILNTPIEDIPMSDTEPLSIEKGTDEKVFCIEPDEKGIYTIEIEELERIEISISENTPLVSGFLRIGAQLKPLPVGSTLCHETGKFYWTPGPGFVGKYHIVFIERDHNNALTRNEVVVDIRPKSIIIPY